jgi:hypothetical protein
VLNFGGQAQASSPITSRKLNERSTTRSLRSAAKLKRCPRFSSSTFPESGWRGSGQAPFGLPDSDRSWTMRTLSAGSDGEHA